MPAPRGFFRSMQVTWGGLALVMALLSGTAAPAHAGRSCQPKAMAPATLQRGLALATKVHERLEREHAASGVRVVLLARAGQDLSQYGVHYSHLGWASRQVLPNGQPSWRVVHKLNACGTARADIHRQGLGEFFLDDLWRYEALVVVPPSGVRDALEAALSGNDGALAVHERRYSMVSYVRGLTYQQSNQWGIEFLVSAVKGPAAAGHTTDAAVEQNRRQAQLWLAQNGYRPAPLQIGAMTRLGGRITAANVAFDDHPFAQRMAGQIQTVTVESVVDWMERMGWVDRRWVEP